MIEVTIPLRSSEEAILVLGPYDRHAKLLRKALDIEIWTRAGNLRLKGVEEDVAEAQRRIDHLLGKHRKGREVDALEVEEILLGPPGDGAAKGPRGAAPEARTSPAALRRAGPRPVASLAGVRVRPFEPRTENQRRYLDKITKHALTLGVGAAGTGKTFLAVGAAVRALRNGECRRLVVTRPVVEAGERLGFLPGDYTAKLNPYLRPVYDALRDLLDGEDVARLEEAGVIEVAPLAYMRGRTLSHSFVILDEAQNTTPSQMKMFLTRLGEHSRMVVTGDPSQSDLEGERKNGLVDAVVRLRGLQEVGLIEFGTADIVRHPLVEKIVRAYDGTLGDPRAARERRREEPRAGERADGTNGGAGRE